MKRLLVIGAGYLGEEIMRLFSEDGWTVSGATLHGGENLLSCDVSDPTAVKQLPDADVVVHCAASGRGGPEAYQRVYVEGCANLAKQFPDSHLVFTSSSSVYAQSNGETVTETSQTSPDRETGRLLLEAERITLGAGGMVARLAGIYGPGRSVLLRKFMNGEALIEEDGRRFINQIHRLDAARAIRHLITLPKFPAGQVFNVTDTKTLSQLEVYQGLAAIFDKELPPSGPRDLNRKRGWTHKKVSSQKLQKTGWIPKFPSFLDAVEGL